MHALVRFAQIPAARTFSTVQIYPYNVAARSAATRQYSLVSLRHDLSKLRGKGLVQSCPARATTICVPRDIPSASSS
jgi:hypothetical protein